MLETDFVAHFTKVAKWTNIKIKVEKKIMAQFFKVPWPKFQNGGFGRWFHIKKIEVFLIY